ncbi:hypothetical protein Tco_1426763, partial [Tanacetum coccineum]
KMDSNYSMAWAEEDEAMEHTGVNLRRSGALYDTARFQATEQGVHTYVTSEGPEL